MKITIENRELVEAVKKVSVSVKDAFKLYISSKEVKADTKQYMASLICSNEKTTYAQTYVCVTSSEKLENPISFIFGQEFGEVVKVLASAGDTFELESDKNERIINISCGDSIVPLALKESFNPLKLDSPQKNTSMNAMVNAEAFSYALSRGGYAFSDREGREASLKNTIALFPVKEEDSDNYALRILSADTSGSIMATSYVHFSPSDKVLVDEYVKEKKYFVVNAPFFIRVIEQIVSAGIDNIELYMMNRQFAIKTKTDMYMMVLMQEYPVQMLLKALLGEQQIGYRFRISSKKLKSAANIAVLNGTTDKERNMCLLKLSGNELTVSSNTNTNRTRIEVEGEGEIEIGVSVPFLKSILEHSPDTVCISGASNVTPIYVNNPEEIAFNSLVLPLRLE